jgi:predicted glutamine amidotransferase
MCELFAMSARFPTTVRLSLDVLARHGGGSGPHRDGWGIAFTQERDALVIREPGAANDSACLAFLQRQEIRSPLVIAHIRRATQGERLLRNTQPFTRELGGRVHLFAHNGMFPGIERDENFTARRFRAVGDTDSEHAFCALLERMAPAWAAGVPSLETRLAVITAFAAALRELGPANFLYSDGDALFAHGHRRMSATGEIRPPGLHLLCRSCNARGDCAPLTGVTIGPDESQQVALLASVPLSDEGWQPLGDGEIVVLRDGRAVRRGAEVAPALQ